MLRPLLMSLILAQFLGLDCGNRERKTRYDNLDGGYTLRDECIMPTDNCFERCHKREAGNACISCCLDHGFLCDTQQAHSFESCDSAP